ncbi:MAG: alpha-mannosidase [Microcystaceae cyanobacterium]
MQNTTIESILKKLRKLSQQDIQPLWRYHTASSLNWEQLPQLFDTLPFVKPNEKGAITWEKGQQIRWFTQKLIIPSHLNNYPLVGLTLRLKLTWWAEDAKIYINHKLVQEGDLFDSTTRLLLSPSATYNQVIWIALRLVSPYHDIGGLMESKLIFEKENHDFCEPSFIADELTILSQYLAAFNPSQLDDLTHLLQQIDWNILPNREKFDLHLNQLRNELKPYTKELNQYNFNLLGHAHLDMAWLWPLSETWDAAQRTFQSVLHLQKEFPSLIFGHTSPLLYQWIEKNRPDLFKAILETYNEGNWEILGGMWVEPDTNLLSGESLVRQLWYGQQYFKEKFGKTAKVAWLTDTFGFTWQLPQILKQGGIEYFVTGKLHWNDTTEFPHGLFKWRSPDQTEIVTLMSPPNVAGVMDTNPLIMMDYAIKWRETTQLKEMFWLPGVGDHGGGPTRDMLQVQKRWHNSEFFPTIQFTTAEEYLNKITNETESLPIWQDELYLELHRGCYTNHCDQKLYNRRCENLLYQAELWSSFAAIVDSNYVYPTKEIETAWKKMLLNQFHDILPGTSIPEVFIEANKDWQQVESVTQGILNQALQVIAHQINLPIPPHQKAKPVIIFNSLNWQRSQIVSLNIEPDKFYSMYDSKGKKLEIQITSENQLLFYVSNIPSVAYQLFWLVIEEKETHETVTDVPKDFILENDLIQVKVNPETGELESIFDKMQQREILAGAGNQLQCFQDQGQYWDAWNIDPNYEEHSLPSPTLTSIEWLENDKLQSRIRVIKNFNRSTFTQDYILQAHSPILIIKTEVNWQETHVLLKATFPLGLRSEVASYEIPCATIQRPTVGKTEADKAKWEVSALHWADLTDNNQNYGVSLLNDCKYGYDSQPNQLRLSLLRGSIWPDPNADKGYHQFKYAIYPHIGTPQTAKTVHQGYEFNIPLQALILDNYNKSQNPTLESSHCFLNLSDHNLIVMAFKPSHHENGAFILRCYECEGTEAKLSLESNLSLKLGQSLNLLEEVISEDMRVKPWQIKSVLVTC